MGLDVVELILRVEEEFAIEIGDDEAAQISTAGQLSQLVMWKLGVHDSPFCASSATFYQTRRDLMKLTATPREQIRPRTGLDQIFPPQQRRQQWQQLKVSSGADLPHLLLPKWLRWAVTLGTFGSAILGFVLFPPDSMLFFVAPFVFATTYLCLTLALTIPWAHHFPASCQTAGDLTKIILISRFRAAPEQPMSARSSEIWQKVQALIADELSVDLEKVTPEADIVRDLGAD